MLKINLLPEGERKATLSPVEQLHRTPLVWVVVAGMILLVITLWIPLAIYQQQVRALDVQIQALMPKKAEVDRLQQFSRQLRAQAGVGCRPPVGGLRSMNQTSAKPMGSVIRRRPCPAIVW